MPLGLPSLSILRTPANFEGPITAFVNGLESSVEEALKTAREALALAGQKSTKPAGGWTDADIATSAHATRSVHYDQAAGVWPESPTASPDVTVFWIKEDATWPDPPIGGAFFREGVHILLKP